MSGWKCSKCGQENEFDRETLNKAMDVALKSLATVPFALLLGTMKALGWLFLGVAALKYTGVI